ncbi:hypothetical protein JHK87_003273 [Glycine soja]|nr:hypothetical protein JHK87_003273 [Glycine soja]
MATSSLGNPNNPEVRKDIVWNRWVIFSPARAKRPSDFKSKSPADPNPNQQCPFCIGHEHECAPEIFRVPPGDPDPLPRSLPHPLRFVSLRNWERFPRLYRENSTALQP